MPVIVSQTESNRFDVRFEYQPLTGGKHKVQLAGDFNDWSPESMTPDGGVYARTLSLKTGRYAYKFVVDGRWMADESAEEFSSAGFDEQNAVAVVGEADAITALRRAVLRYEPETPATSVAVAASFNGWNPATAAMQQGDDGVWSIDLLLVAGEYAYKLVIDDQLWITDPSAAQTQPDGFGGENAVLEVTLDHPRVRLERQDGRILTWGLPVEPGVEMVNLLSPTLLELKRRTHVNDVEAVDAIVGKRRIPLHRYDADDRWDYWRCEIALASPDEALRFAFVFRDAATELYLLEGGFSPVFDDTRMFTFHPSRADVFLVPEWARRAIFYQIFPDRFRNGDPSLNQDFSEWYYNGLREPPKKGVLGFGQEYYHFVNDWSDYSVLTQNPLDPDGRGDWAAFYGGDFAGVRQKLDYLVDLGVTCIYFNPVFQSRSTHRYDASDYRRVDPHLGTNEDFRALVDNCHAHGVRVILDCAFNHTGDTHMAFIDARQRGPSSSFWDWYEFKQWPLPEKDFHPADYYECWWGHGNMPDLNYDLSRPAFTENGVRDLAAADPNWPVVQYILGLADFWLGEMDVDGFRLDVPNEVPWWFWELFRKRVKHVKPSAYLVGEIWRSAAEWVSPVYFDAVMNYAWFRDPVLRFFAKRVCGAAAFDRDIKPGRLTYPAQAAQAMMNLLDSHDTHRFIESCGDDSRRLRLAVLFQMTYVGAPHVYYGDEIGMRGGHDPDNRRPFNWSWESDADAVALHGWYRRLAHIRREHDALSFGEFHTLLTIGRLYAYKRVLGDETVAVVINNEDDETTATLALEPGRWVDLLTDRTHVAEGGELTLRLDPMCGAVLVPLR